ncbi:hypothetical protein [Campylobacter concisus]|uniref:hypothetical protein n=1 Tax=Campylobacter concisus TaxID=199 RepID=UPI0011E81DED|nr:hypothetical protein [Campylobacter concisus]
MAESHLISPLINKHSEFQGVEYHRDIVLKLKSELKTIDKTIVIFGLNYKKIIKFIKTKQDSMDKK